MRMPGLSCAKVPPDLTKARWQSGYAADCNSVYAGSIPTLASISSSQHYGHMAGIRLSGQGHVPPQRKRQ